MYLLGSEINSYLLIISKLFQNTKDYQYIIFSLKLSMLSNAIGAYSYDPETVSYTKMGKYI